MSQGLELESASFRRGQLWVLVETNLHVPPGGTLVLNPNFIFLDDPDQGLDEATTELVLELLVRLRDDAGRTVVLTTTDPVVVERLGVPVMRLEYGTLVSGERQA